VNIFAFTGNLGRDAEQRYTQKGDSIVSFSVGVSSGYGENKSTTWANCSIFGKRGDSVLPYLKKGQQVAVHGEASLREWKTKDGETRTNLEVRVNDLTLLGSKGDKPAKQEKEPSYAGHEDDIPF
jgi:single-strand DNA-binding protein